MRELLQRWRDGQRCRREHDECPHHGRHHRPADRSGARWDIQGLRAFAVLAVVANHLTEWPRGGFVGVDVFFVISGFLITGHLVREYDSTGAISAREFYRKRAKRILPASVVVIIATVVVSMLALPSNRSSEVRTDGLWALLFGANWRFGLEETDYFNQDRLISPLQHYWSLGIEEQFYFVWPWVMLAILALHARRSTLRSRGHLIAGAAMAGIIVVSFALAVVQTNSDADFAYFSTFTRVWELGVGALLAIGSAALTRIPDAVRPALAWVGFSGMVASLWVVDASAGFPAPWAALPVVATGLVIAAGTRADREQQVWLWPLTNRASGWIGDVSYSLYLWHFPVIILLAAVVRPDTTAFYVVALVLMAALTVFSYYVIEEPARRLPWRASRSRRRRDHPVWVPARYASLGSGVVVTCLLVVAALNSTPTVTRPAFVDNLEPGQSSASKGAVPAVDKRQEDLLAALEAATVPSKFSPDLSTLTGEQWGQDILARGGCTEVTRETASDCVFGDDQAPRTAVVVGDSYAMAWMPTILAALERRGFEVHQVTRAECPAWGLPITRQDGSAFPECEEHLSWVTEHIQGIRPDLTIVAQADNGLSRLADGEDASAIADGFAENLKRLESASGAVAVLAAPPGGIPLQECVTSFGDPSDCVSTVGSQWEDVFAAEAAAVDATNSSVHIDTRPWFCFNDYCPGWVGTMPIRADGGHMTPEYAESLAPLLWASLRPQLR